MLVVSYLLSVKQVCPALQIATLYGRPRRDASSLRYDLVHNMSKPEHHHLEYV